MVLAPCQVRGLVSTLIMSGFRIVAMVFYILRCVGLLVFFVILMCAANWYKLRKRDDVIPYHMFTEDQFESDYREERKWLNGREHLFESSSLSTESQ